MNQESITMENFRKYIIANEEIKKERMDGVSTKIYTPTSSLDGYKKVVEIIGLPIGNGLIQNYHILWDIVRKEGNEMDKIAFYEMMARYGAQFGYNNMNLSQNLIIFDHFPRLLERVESLEKRLAIYEEKGRVEQDKKACQKVEDNTMGKGKEDKIKLVTEKDDKESDNLSKGMILFKWLKNSFKKSV